MERREKKRKIKKYEVTIYRVDWFELLRACNHYNEMKKTVISAASLLAVKHIPFIAGSVKIRGTDIEWEEITGKIVKGEVITLR